MKYSGVIFDFNGVIWFDTKIQETAWMEFASSLINRPVSQVELKEKMHGRTNKSFLEYLLNKSLSNEEVLELTKQKETLYKEMCIKQGENFKLSPGAMKLFDYLLEHDIPHTIATASEITNLKFFIEHLKLDKWFDISKIIYDDGTFPGKPAPDIYLKAAASIDVSPAKCIVIEDSISGMKAARNAGIGIVVALAAISDHEKLLGEQSADYAIETLADLNTHMFAIN